MDNRKLLEIGELADFENYNRRYYNGEFAGSEARPFHLENIRRWIAIRGKLTYVEEENLGEQWRTLDIKYCHSKYGCNYIYIDLKNKLWRTTQTAGEFYGWQPPVFKEEELR